MDFCLQPGLGRKFLLSRTWLGSEAKRTRKAKTSREKRQRIFWNNSRGYRSLPSKSEGREWGVGSVVVEFGVFGAPRFSVQRSQNTCLIKGLGTPDGKSGRPKNAKFNHDGSNPPFSALWVKQRFEANRSRKFTRTFVKFFVTQFLCGAFSVPNSEKFIGHAKTQTHLKLQNSMPQFNANCCPDTFSEILV